MTRGYFCVKDGSTIKSAVYLHSDAYLEYYGTKILTAIRDGKVNDFIKDEEAVDDFRLNWICPDKVSRADKNWRYEEYGYVYDVAKDCLKVYYYGKPLATVPIKSSDKALFVFENDISVIGAYSYDPLLLGDRKDTDYCKAVNAIMQMTLPEIKKLAKDGHDGDYVYLEDYHCIAPGHRPGHEVYRKQLSSTASGSRLDFIVEHDGQLGEYGWNVYIQTPYARIRCLNGPGKYSSFVSEKMAVKGIRELVRREGAHKFLRLAEVFNEYYEARKSIEDMQKFAAKLPDMYKEDPFFTCGGLTPPALKTLADAWIQRELEKEEKEI